MAASGGAGSVPLGAHAATPVRSPRRWTRICLAALLLFLASFTVVFAARQRASLRKEALTYTPLTGEADWQGDWTLSPLGADPSEAGSRAGTDKAVIPFQGTGLALRVRRGTYRANFWVRVDGEPANRLPRTGRGAYLVLTSPEYASEPEVDLVPVAGGLEDGSHVAEVIADRGWGQFPLVGWRVRRGPSTAVYDQVMRALAAGAAVSLAGFLGLVLGRGGASVDPAPGPRGGLAAVSVPGRLPVDLGSLDTALTSPVTLLLAAGLFYFSPWWPVTLGAGLVLVGVVMLRLDLGLALVALSAPFYLHPRPVLGKAFSMAEILTLFCLVSWGVRQMRQPRAIRRGVWAPSWADRAVLLLVVGAAAATVFAERRHVALREFRVTILEPALFYGMLRTTRLADEGRRWWIIDGLVAGGAAVALIGLAQYAFDVNVITAEEGFRRLRSVYGSPNNAALYLGRVLPVLLAVTVLGRSDARRTTYGLLALPVGLAILLSFSRAAILLGVPCALLVMGLAAGGRWRWISLALLLLAGLGLSPLLSTPRFRGLFDPQSGTLFFRLQLWRSSLNLVKDHPWLGVGPDNFLYAYRGRYILPTAWQEPHLSHAHNIALTYLTRLGVVGLAAGLGLQAAFWRAGLTAVGVDDGGNRALSIGLVGSTAYVVAHGMVDASFFFPDLAFAFLLGLGLVQCSRR